MIKRHSAIRVLYSDQRLIESTLSDSAGCPSLTDQRQIIDGVAIDALERGNGISTNALLRLWMHFTQVQVTGVDHWRLAGFSDLRVITHHLGAASND